jgi:hypothetical protein
LCWNRRDEIVVGFLEVMPTTRSHVEDTMARTSRRSTRRIRKTRRSTSPKRTTIGAADIEAVVDAETKVDGCDVDFTLGAITTDAELPPARGGVEDIRRMSLRRRATRR